jgi:3D (Asp-Asp-Asp) domain-containing protein
LPKYETPLVKRDFQNVRTTAYTHTESDHRQFTNHNALGGTLHAATGAIRRAEYTPRALPVSGDDQSDYRRASYNPATLERFSMEPRRTTKIVKTKHGKKRVVVVTKPQIGSAAADWSRWPAGTVFRLLSTGQVYKVDDYGWALAGRNTIDLYMPTRGAMNSWGAREENIQILRWGDSNESLRLLQGHQGYRHIRRMVLELQGQDAAAASLE